MKTSFIVFFCILSSLYSATGWAQAARLLTNDSLLKTYLIQTRFDIDPDAQAVVLYEKGKADFKNYGHARFNVTDYTLEYTVEKVIKIVKATSLDEANISIPYSKNISLKNVTGTTINLEQGIIIRQPLDPKSILKERISDDLRQYKFNLANVKPGTILHYSFTYSVDLDFYRLVSNGGLTWSFQNTLPTLCSEFELIVAPDKIYKEIAIIPKNVSFIDKYTEKDFIATDNSQYSSVIEVKRLTETLPYVRKLWKRNNTIPIKEEPMVVNGGKWEQEIRLLVSSNSGFKFLPKSWDSANSSYYNNLSFGKLIFSVPNDAKDSVLEQLTKRYTNKLDLAKAIYRQFRDSINYNQYIPTLTEYLAHSDRKNNKNTRTSNFNLRLTQILRKAGFKSFPVILSTTDKGSINAEYFEPDAINYVLSIVAIDDRYYLLDASSRYLPFGVLKPKCYNGFSWIISDKGIPIDISPDSLSDKTVCMATLTPGSRNGIYNLKMEQKLGNVTGPATRIMIANDSVALHKTLEQGISALKHNMRLKGLSFINKDNPDTNLVINYDLELELDTSNELTYLNPFFKILYNTNPFTASTRLYPVEFGHTFHYQFILKFQLPDSYTLEDYDNQASLVFANGNMRYQNTMLYDPSKRVFSLNSIFSTKTPTIPAEDYNELRSFYDKVITEQNKKITLRKTLRP